MFEKLLQKLLKDVVGEFIDGIDTKKLNIGIWSGTVEIVNVSLKPRLLVMLGLPYRITFSNISRLFITIPWKNLFTAPLVIQIQSIQILAQNSSYQLSRQEQGKILLLKIKQFIQKLGRELATNKKQTQEKGSGYLETVYLKMLDNLYLTIRNIHFRFEVSRPLKQEPESTPFSFGITLQLIELFAVDEKGNRVFIDRTKLSGEKNIIYKKLKLQNFGFYWNYQEKQAILLSLQAQFPVKPSQERYFKDMLDFKQIMAGKSISKQKLNYVILINAEGLVKQDNRVKASSKTTKYEVSFNIKQIKMVLNQRIIKQAVWFLKQTSMLSMSSNSFASADNLDKWDGPKNQNFLGLLRKYCINEFWQTDNNGKTSTPLSALQQKMLMSCLSENKQNLQIIENKVKQIIVGDIGNKNAVMKSEIINNWQSIEALMNEQKKIEQGQLQIKFCFEMEELCLFYLDQIKIPIAQLFIKGFKISADHNQDKGLNLEIQIAKLEGLGYDQNPIIRMEHEIESPSQSPKVMKFPKLFALTFKYKEDVGQELDIALGGIGFLYDFKTFRQIYKLPESLISTQPTQTPVSPPTTINNQRSSIAYSNSDARNSLRPQSQSGSRSTNKFMPSQITVTIENISLYILQYTKKTWRLSLSGCQLTNSTALIPENILINAISLSVSDFYVCQPFGAKIVLNLRESMPDIAVLIEPIKIKINSDVLKNLLKIPSCLETYKKTDAISLSSKYGELYLLEDKDVWKKYDGVIIDGLLYLYEKNEEYSKYQFRVMESMKKTSNKRDVIEILVKEEEVKVLQKYYLIVRNQAQFEEWAKNLTDLSESNKKQLVKPSRKELQQINKIEQAKQKASSSKKNFNLSLLLQELSFFALESESIQQSIIGFIVRKANVQFVSIADDQQFKPTLDIVKKPSEKQKPRQSQEQFKSLRFQSVFSKNSKVETENEGKTQKLESYEAVEKQINAEVKKLVIEIKDIEYWYKKQKRLYCFDDRPKNQSMMGSEQREMASIVINLLFRQNQINVNVNILDRIVLHYEPYQILQIMSYLNNRISSIFTPPPNTKKPNTSETQIKQQSLVSPVPPQSKICIDLDVKKGIEVNLFNMLSYQSGQNHRDQVMRIICDNLKVSVTESNKRVEVVGIKGEWFGLHDTRNQIISNFGVDNRVVVQILSNKLMVKVYELYLPNYQHYIVMRAIDYLLVQLKQVVLYPVNFNQYFDVFTQGDGKCGTHTRMYRYRDYLESKMTQTQIWERIKNLYQMEVHIYGGYVGLQNLGYATVGYIRVTNSFVESYNGSTKGNVLCDQYLIQFKDFNIWLITGKGNLQDKEMSDEKNRQEIMKRIQKHKSYSVPQASQGKQQQKQQRFFTVLNRFSNQFTQSDWFQRQKSNLVELIDPEWPLDMSLTVTMFGKYPQYKTIFQNFETSTINTTMPIKLVLSEVHINITPSQLKLISNLANRIVQNVFYTDQMSYYYSYDEQVMRAIYKRQMEKMTKEQPSLKLIYDTNNIIVISAPIHSVLNQDEYIYSPIQFAFSLKYANLKILTLAVKDEENTDKKPELGNLMGIQTILENFQIDFTQFPLNQTKISLSSFDLIYVCGDYKAKIMELTSAEERQSRDTMFIDNFSNKKQNISRPDLFKSEPPQAFNDNSKQNEGQMNQKGEQQSRSIDRQNLIRGSQKESKQAFSFKMFKKVKRISTKVPEEKKPEQVSLINTEAQIMEAIELNFHNIVLNYDISTITFLLKLRDSVSTQNTDTEQLKNKQKSEETAQNRPNDKKLTEFLCRVHSFLLKTSMEAPEAQNSQIDKGQMNSGEKMCILIKLALLTQLPALLPLRVDVEHMEAYMEQMSENKPYDQPDGFNKKETLVINIHEARKSSQLKNKKKTLLQPTKLFYRRKISEQAVKVKIEKPKEEPTQNLMSSKIKSILNIAPSYPESNSPSSKVIEQFHRVQTLALLTQVDIDRCFVKISIQDLQKLGKFSKILNSQLQKHLNKPKSKSTPQSQNNHQKPTQSPQKIHQQQQPQPQPQQQQQKQLKIINKISFKPIEVVIMNETAYSNTPLLYTKMLITGYDVEEFSVEIVVNYFNLRVNSWEPLVQNNVLMVKLYPHLAVQKAKQPLEDRLSKPHSSKSSRRDPNSQKFNEYVNINISTNFLQALIPALQSKTTDNSSLRLSQTKSVGDEVNCWMVINQLGYDISCESKSFRGTKMSTIINIPNNKTRKLTFLNDMSEGLGFQEALNNQGLQSQMLGEGSKKNRWTISIIINNQFRIKEIDIGQIGLKKYCFNYEGYPFWIYGHTYVDISKNVKYIKFYSEVMIVNSTNLELWIKLPPKQEKPQTKQAENKDPKKPIALGQGAVQKKLERSKKERRYSHDYRYNEDMQISSNQFLQVKSRDMKNKSEYIGSDDVDDDSMNERLETSFRKAHSNRLNYVKLAANKDVSLAFDLDQNFKKLSQNQFSDLISRQPVVQFDVQQEKARDNNLQKVEKYQKFQIQKQRKKMRTIYKILPVGKIVNKLPQQINIALKVQDHILYAYSLIQDQSQFIYTSFSQLEISVHSKGFQWSVFTPCHVVEMISLLDFNYNKLNMKVNLFVDEDGIDTIILYPIAVLYNDTDYDLHIRDPECKSLSYNKVLPKKSVTLTNYRILVLKPSLPESSGFTSQHSNYTKVYMSQEQITCKFELASTNIEPVTSKKLEHIPPTAIQALLINQISLKTSASNTANMGINTKFVTVSHKYYFSNKTSHTIIVRRYSGADSVNRFKSSNFNVRVYEPNTDQSFWLFEQDSVGKDNLFYYELTIKNSQYEWSGALSIARPGNNHFLLRNRANFNDVHFMNLTVIKYHQIEKFKIELKDGREEIPYVIKNSWTGFLIKLPEFGNIVLKEGDHVDFSWDQPLLKKRTIPILVGYAPEGQDKLSYYPFQIKTENSQENELIKFKRLSQMGEICIVDNPTKTIQIRQYQKAQRKTQKLSTEIQLPIRIALINNSFSPVYHLCDFSASVCLKINTTANTTILRLQLDSVQVDNQTRYRVYFPVVLSTSMALTVNFGKNIQAEIQVKPIMFNIQEDFGKDFYATAMLIYALVQDKRGVESLNRIVNQSEIANKVLVSKLILPAVTINLQIKTKKLSIETTINLQKPAVTKYPWQSFPYPVKNIAITLLSHLSISPWALISSFQKGVVSLLTEQESSKGIEGFFGQILAALSNSVNGLVGILVGHDIERVNNFFEGLEQGSNLLVQQVAEIGDCFQPEQCTISSILASLGYGIASIVLKPMKGVLQMTLKISEGIKKTALFSFEDSSNRFKQRDAIVFYGQQEKFRTYDANQSHLMVLMLKICGEPLKYFHLLKFFVINNKQNGSSEILCIGTEQVMLINAKAQKLIWQVNLHEVSKIYIVRSCCIRFSPFQYDIDAVYEDLTDQILALLLRLHKKVFIKA